MGQKSLKVPIIPYMGIRFLAITQPSLASRAEILYDNSRYNYLLVMKNPGFGPYLRFWALLVSKKGRGPTDTHMGLGPQNLT